MQDVIAGAWEGDPHKRLSAQELVHLLVEAQAAVEQMDAECPRAVVSTANVGAGSGLCCVIS